MKNRYKVWHGAWQNERGTYVSWTYAASPEQARLLIARRLRREWGNAYFDFSDWEVREDNVIHGGVIAPEERQVV
jgi:hypothetical protein